MQNKKLNFSKKLSELVGILLGDGYFSSYVYRNKRHYRIQITLDSRNKQYISYVANLIVELFGIKPKIRFRKNENTCDIRVFNKKLFEYLSKEVQLKFSPKWDRAAIPKQFLKDILFSNVLRGYFDTDGCITITNNNGTKYPRIELKICPSPMQKQFITGLTKLGFRFGVYEIGKGQVRVQLNGKQQVIRWHQLVGSNNLMKLNRFLPYVTNINH